MKNKDFISELISYGTGFALTFLAVVGMSVVFVLGLAVVVLAAFFDRLFN